MSERPITVGDIVTAEYKTGHYIGEVVQIKPPQAVIKVLAVLKHPTQGNLHRSQQADMVMFHQRRALAFQEFALVLLATVKPYDEKVLEYKQSLLAAVDRDLQSLHAAESTDWTKRSIEQLNILKKEYE